MILTVSVEGVLADAPSHTTFAAAKQIHEGAALVLALLSTTHTVFLFTKHSPKLVRSWLDKHIPMTQYATLLEAQRSSEGVAKTRSEYGLVLFHVDSDPEEAEQVRVLGVPTLLFEDSETIYPPKNIPSHSWAAVGDED